MADEPTVTVPPVSTQVAMDALTNFVTPLKGLIAWHDQMKAQGSLERAATEAQSRAAAAQRDLDTATTAHQAAEKAAKAAKAQADKSVADAAKQAQDKLDAANAEAARLIADGQAQADALISAANDELHTIEGQQADARKTLADLTSKTTTAQSKLDEVQGQLDSVKARLG